MEKLLLFIKHHFRFLWTIIEWCNGLVFSLLYQSRMGETLQGVLGDIHESIFSYKRLTIQDDTKLYNLIKSQASSDLKYFKPHEFNMRAIRQQFRNSSFLMMGAFLGNNLVGYFFLRCFANRKCFVGRLIDKDYRGTGIGLTMNYIMYETAWRMGFRCLSTISKNNTAVIRAHSKNRKMVVLKELQDDYMLVEFLKDGNAS